MMSTKPSREQEVFSPVLFGKETFRETQALKQHLHRYVQLNLDKLEEKKRLGLMERRNASDLCIDWNERVSTRAEVPSHRCYRIEPWFPRKATNPTICLPSNQHNWHWQSIWKHVRWNWNQLKGKGLALVPGCAVSAGRPRWEHQTYSAKHRELWWLLHARNYSSHLTGNLQLWMRISRYQEKT